MKILVNFLRDSAKIVFGSAVVTFFVPGDKGEIGTVTFLGGLLTTVVFLSLAMILNKLYQKQKLT